MKNNYILQIKWSVSRGRNTYGYNICSLYVDGQKSASCNGGGYDMEGSVLGDWMTREFQHQLKSIDETQFYGIRKNYETNKTYLDGACGFSSMTKILNAIGYDIQKIPVKGNGSMYLVNPKNPIV